MEKGNQKRGRKPGSVTFATISLGDLTAKFKDPKALIVVGNKWSEQLKLNAQAIVANSKIAAPKPAQPSVGTITDPNQS